MRQAVAKPTGALRADMSNILVLEPMIACTALFMKHREIGEDNPGDVAATNGQSVSIWPAFHRHTPEERAGILLHEYLHAAFAHPLRAFKLKLRFGAAYRHDILNIAGDAIINEGIRKNKKTRIQLPEGLVDLQKLVEQAKTIVELTGIKLDCHRMGALDKLTLEWLYDALTRLEAAAKEWKCAAARKDNSGNKADADSHGKNSSPKDPRERKLDEFLQNFNNGSCDINLDGLSGLTQIEVDNMILEAGERLRNAMAMGHGTRSGNIIEQLQYDIPEVRTPWEASFRTITQRHLARTRQRSPGKPGRRVLSQEAMGLSNIIWSAGRRRLPVPRVAVVIDSSGSTQPPDYLRYLGEIQAMKRRTNAQVIAIVADANVQSVIEIKDIRDIADIEFNGRGGTDFRPAIALAEEMDVDLLVYLTDLQGTFPKDEPPFPVLWTLLADEIPAGYQPPFGRVLLID